MSVLPSNNLNGLDGWGKGLKKAVGQAVAVPKALLIPTPKNIKAAVGSMKIAAPIAASVAAVTLGAPMLASAASGMTSALVGGKSSGGQQAQADTAYYDAGAAAPDSAVLNQNAVADQAPAPVKKTNWLKAVGYTALGLKLVSMVL